MVWVSLEEAEPISDISWGIRVLQPPPEQENVEYGELGQRQGAPSPGSPAHSTEVPSPASCLPLWGASGPPPGGVFLPLVDGHGAYTVQASGRLLWESELGIPQARSSVGGHQGPEKTGPYEACGHTSPRMLQGGVP